MSTLDFTLELFCRVDDVMKDVPKHPQAKLWPSELVTLALLLCLKGGSFRTFDRWVRRDLLLFFPNLPDRTRLLRSLMAPRHRAWAERFLAEPTFFGIIDSYGIELTHPRRRGRSKKQIGTAGISNHRWIAGAKLCAAVNQQGLFCDWDLDTASTHDTHFHVIAKRLKHTLLFADSGFHQSEKRGGDPDNLHICKRGERNERFLIETVFSLLTRVLHLKRLGHRTWEMLEVRLGYALATFNVLSQWKGHGKIDLAIAKFAL